VVACCLTASSRGCSTDPVLPCVRPLAHFGRPPSCVTRQRSDPPRRQAMYRPDKATRRGATQAVVLLRTLALLRVPTPSRAAAVLSCRWARLATRPRNCAHETRSRACATAAEDRPPCLLHAAHAGGATVETAAPQSLQGRRRRKSR
jgi:hypothetical protein